MQKFVGILVVLMILCSFTACSDGEKKSPPKEKQEKVTHQQSTQQESSIHKHRLSTFLYHDDQYHFSLEFPQTWKDQFTVSKGNWFTGAEATIDFKYKNGGYVLFSILVFPLDQAAWEKQNGDNLLQYLATNQKNQTFALSTPSEMPPELNKNDPATVEKSAYVSNMINVDIPKIIKTFKIQ